MSQGKGISDAVRGAIREWITPDIIDQLWAANAPLAVATSNSASFLPRSKDVFTREIRGADSWVRRVRRRISNGWERDYDCKAFPRSVVGLRVHTNLADTNIRYVTFRMNGRLISGGVVSVPSVLVSQRGRVAQLSDVTFANTPATPGYRPFTADELHQLATDVEFGSGTFDSMFEDRV